MKYNALLFSLLISITFLFSCEKTEKLEDFPLYPPKLVLNSYLNADSTISIHLSKSLSVLDNADIKNINDGTIKLYENGNPIATLNSTDGYGNYFLNYKPKVGATYNVEASAPSLSDISSKTTIPTKAPIEKFTAEYIKISEWNDGYKFKITITDPPEKNYYMLMVYESGISYYIVGNDTIFYKNYPEKVRLESSTNPAMDEVIMGNAYFKDNFFNGKKYTFDVDMSYAYYSSDKIKFTAILYSLNEAEYKYRLSLGKYWESSDNPFAEPVQVYNNIKGGYGIFGGQSIGIDSVKVKGHGY